MKIILIIALFIVTNSYAAKTVFHTATIDEIHPTQFVYGSASVIVRKAKIEDKFKAGKLRSYIAQKPAPAVIGPDGKYYIVDRHHLTRALYEADIPEKYKTIKILVIDDFRNKSQNKFFKYLKENKFTYLKKTGEKKRPIQSLPGHIKDLENDPYRSLSWIVRERGGYHKSEIPFLEFYWAEYFYKNKIVIDNGIIKEDHINKAKEVALHKKAMSLPGYRFDLLKCEGNLNTILNKR